MARDRATRGRVVHAKARPICAEAGTPPMCAEAALTICAEAAREEERWEQGLPPLQNGRAARWPEANCEGARSRVQAAWRRLLHRVHRWAQVCSHLCVRHAPSTKGTRLARKHRREEPCGYDPSKLPGADALRASRRRPRVGLEATAGRRRSAPLRANLRSADVFRPGGRISRIRPR